MPLGGGSTRSSGCESLLIQSDDDRLDKYADDQRAAVVVESDGRGRSGRDVELLVFRAAQDHRPTTEGRTEIASQMCGN